MPVRYRISPALNMIIFVCRGAISGPQIFEVSELARRDNRFKYGMTIIIDLLSAVDNFELADIQEAIRRMNQTAEQGKPRANIVILSMSTGIRLLVDAMKLMPSNVPLNIQVCHSLDEASEWLGMSCCTADLIRFWRESQVA